MIKLLQGDCRAVMAGLPEASVVEIARRRIASDAPLFAQVDE